MNNSESVFKSTMRSNEKILIWLWAGEGEQSGLLLTYPFDGQSALLGLFK